MRTRFAALAVAACALPIVSSPPPVAGATDVIRPIGRAPAARSGAAFRDGEMIVAFRSDTDGPTLLRLLRAGGAREARRARFASRYLVTLEPGIGVTEAVSAFSAVPEVEYAEPNGYVHGSQAVTFKPNDTYYRYQWNMTQMNAERTWGIQKGRSTVAVAIVDTGVAYEDYDDPRTGQAFRKAPDWGDTVFLPGYDFVNGDDHANDDEGHGTHVASTVAEATDNEIGVAGLAFACAILPVKVLDGTGSGTFFDLADGIDYAASYERDGARPVKVINLSLGTEGYSETVKRAIDSAVANDVLVVAAAGNAGKPTVEFPASLPNVVAVGALDERKERAFYSNTGSDLDVMAPGGDCDRDDDGDGVKDCIWQQTLNDRFVALGRYDQFCYCGLDGTSMATAHVSASAALLFSQGFTDPAAVRLALEQTAERLGGASASGRDDTYGFGLVRPANALPGLGFNQGPTQ